MTPAQRAQEVGEADRFLAAPKFLDGPAPAWRNSAWGGEYSAVWNVLDELGSPVAQLKFTARRANTAVASASLVYRGRPLWRLDLDEAAVCHSNWHDAHLYGLPALVCGPHEHGWDVNRAHVLSQDIWGLPYRRPLDPAIRRLDQGLLWLAGQISLTIDPEQRGFGGPTRADLFDIGGR